MAGSKFQYDESGGTFFYFLLSFLALILIPSSYYFWPSWRDKEDECEKTTKQCHCERCMLKKSKLITKEPWKKKKQVLHAVLIALGWLAFAATAYKVSHLDRDYVDWDPFAILEIDRGATTSEIKHAYRRLSLIYHPDKQSGDPAKFLQLTKAHAALTDDEAKKNWEMYGNPDGPGAMSFGIALPSWIVEKENSIWVLGLYALVFMVALPTVVWIWWRRSIQYGGDQILLDTTKLYYFYISKTPSMNLKRLLMVLAGSLEFWKDHNSEVVDRPSDNIEIPTLIKKFDSFGEKNKEPPLCYSYSVKARALLFAHLHRMELPPLTIEQDRLYIVKKCPFLIHELVQCISQIMMIALSGHVSTMPTLDTLENCMKLSPMIIQAMWDNKNPLLQLPHIQDDMLRHFVTKTRYIRGIRQMVSLKSTDRRSLLRALSDEEYDDVMNVCSKMPHIIMVVSTAVLDDDKPTTITTGAIVTVTIQLTRLDMDTQFGQEVVVDQVIDRPGAEDETGASQEVVAVAKKTPVWKKQPKKKSKSGAKAKKKNVVKKVPKKATIVETKSEDPQAKLEAGGSSAAASSRTGEDDDNSGSELDESNKESDSESESRTGTARSGRDSKKEKDGGEVDRPNDDDDDDEAWRDIQAKQGNRETNIDGKSLKSHPVHCPFFPEEKQEHWWLYIVDTKFRIIKMPPEHITDLQKDKTITLKFTAPDKVGVFNYMVHLRSDSYIDGDISQKFKLDVQPGLPTPIIEYGLSEDEKEEESSESEDLGTDDGSLSLSDDD